MDNTVSSQPQSQPEPEPTSPVNTDNSPSPTPTTLPGPKGIGMAVAFDWGLTAQLLVAPLLPLVVRVSSSRPGVIGSGSIALSFLAALPFAALIAVFGEGVRRGWRWTRLVQVVINSLGFLGGLISLIPLWQSLQTGHYWPLVTSVILLVFSPLIAWRLSRPQTANWFAHITSAEARKRHGGAWPYLIALWALVGGILQALAVSLR
jgi:hypothetical protein